MTRTSTAAVAFSAGMVLLAAVACLLMVEFDSDGWAGAGVGAALGLLNLAVGYWVIQRALKRGMKSAMTTLLGGFLARLVVLAGLAVLLHSTGAADAAAFALVFMAFFFVYVAVEVVLVERSLRGTGRAA